MYKNLVYGLSCVHIILHTHTKYSDECTRRNRQDQVDDCAHSFVSSYSTHTNTNISIHLIRSHTHQNLIYFILRFILFHIFIFTSTRNRKKLLYFNSTCLSFKKIHIVLCSTYIYLFLFFLENFDF